MAIEVQITDGRGFNGEASVIKQPDVPSGLVTYTEPYKTVISQTKSMVNATYGADFNVNAAFSGTPVGIHDGTDSVEWTASALSGTWDFASTTQNQAGTKSVEAINTINNNEAQFEGGSPISTGGYTAISGYIHLTGWATSGTKDVTFRNRLAGVNVGLELSLSDYIDTTLIGSWQKFTITLADFAMPVQNIDQLVVKTVDIGSGAPPNYYLDEMNYQEAGSAVWTVEPDKQSIFRITQLNITLADALDTTLTAASHQNLAYNKLLGLSALTSGINLKLTTGGIVRFNGNFRQHLDFVGYPGIEIQSGGDGTNAWVSYNVTFDPPFTMDSRTEDKFELTISEDLSGLLSARVLVRGGKEETELT